MSATTDAFKHIHPKFTAKEGLWHLMEDSYEGEHAVKEAGDKYLPATPSMYIDGYPTADKPGTRRYNNLKMGAVFPDFVEHAVTSAISRMHRKPPKTIDLKGAYEPLEDRISSMNESLPTFLRRINVNQLKSGRLGVLGEVEERAGAAAVPVVNLYNALAVINWDDTSVARNTTGVRLVVLDESRHVLDDDFVWRYKNFYRVLAMCKLEGEAYIPSNEGTVYCVAILKDQAYDILGAEYTPVENMGKTLDAIPFVFINTMDIAADPTKPPLLSLANLCMTIYRGEAAYRNTLFMQGEETLVKIGALPGDDKEETRVGTGASITVPMGGDAKFIGLSGSGLAEQRTSLENDHKRAAERAGKLSEAIGDRTSGEALRIRVEAQNVTLPQIAMTGAEGLTQVLRILAPLFNVDPESIVIEPNIEFSNSIVDGRTLLDIVNSRGLGAPISKRSIHRFAVEQGLTTLSFEEEMELIRAEDAEDLANTPTGNIVPEGDDDVNLPDGTVDPNENS